MRSSLILVLVSVVSAIVACESDDAIPPPVIAPFGLEARPKNATCKVPARPVIERTVKLEPAFPGLTFNQPTYITQAPGDNERFYVLQKPGILRTFTRATTSNDDVTDFVALGGINDDGEGGLLGMAFAPDFATSRVLYLSYTSGGTVANYTTNMRSTLVRARSTNGIALDEAPTGIFDVGQPYNNHNGGNIQFGADGFLYFGLGDGGAGADPLLAGQDLTTPLGKILRLDVSNLSAPAGIPADNPFASEPNARSCNGYEPQARSGPGAGPCKEIWAYGFRNPWRFSFDRTSGELWVGDVGQGTWEEIDARVTKGGNYGWSECEGKHVNASTTLLCTKSGLINPIVEHDRAEARSITGGYVYRGSAIPALQGTYIYGDYATGNIWAIVYDTAGNPSSELITNVGNSSITSFGEGNDGELYVVVRDEIRKFVATGGVTTDTFPNKLSATGCFAVDDPKQPAEGLVPYDLISTLWSDGSDKIRYFALPDDKTITIQDDGDWDFPIGTVLVKTFSLGGVRIETRLFMRHDDGGWAGYTYEWNDAQTDATLLPGSKTKPVGAQTWTYPSRSQCLQCHTEAAGGSLGLDTMNMNRDAMYAATNRVSPQLATLEHIGMFANALPAVRSAYASPTDAAQPIAERARAYMQTNCAHCHRPDGGGQGSLDLRHSLLLAETGTCNVMNTQGAIAGAENILVPGDPARSVLSRRVHAMDSKRMPPIAVSVPDAIGIQVIDDYIRSLTACP